MGNTKRNFIILTVISTVFSLLGVLFYKLFPKMKQCCEEMKEKCCPEGAECCAEEPEPKPKKKRTRKKK